MGDLGDMYFSAIEESGQFDFNATHKAIASKPKLLVSLLTDYSSQIGESNGRTGVEQDFLCQHVARRAEVVSMSVLLGAAMSNNADDLARG